MTRHLRTATMAATVLVLVGAAQSGAQSPIKTERVSFARGASSATINSTIRGETTIDYLVSARGGQVMNVSLGSRSSSVYFNLIAPGERDVAFYNSSIDGNQYEGTLPATGEYRIRVYLVRAAARRNERADIRLEIAISGRGGNSGDATVGNTGFNATGNIPCSMGNGAPTGSCQFGVVREGPGKAMVTVTKPDGSKRVIFFDRGRPIGYDQSQADRGEFSASQQRDLFIVRIGNERYEIPDAVVNGS